MGDTNKYFKVKTQGGTQLLFWAENRGLANRLLPNLSLIRTDFFFVQFEALGTEICDQILGVRAELFPDFEALKCKFSKNL